MDPGDSDDETRIKELMEIAKEMEQKTGVSMNDDIIRKASEYIASLDRKKEDRKCRHIEQDKQKGKAIIEDLVGDFASENNRPPGDYADGPDKHSTSLKALIKELEKLSQLNKDLQSKWVMNDRVIHKLSNNVSELKNTLDEERGNVATLIADRERLKLDIEDYKRKFHAVLFLSGTSEKDVTIFFQKNPRATQITDEMIGIREEMKKYTSEKENRYELLNPEILSRRINQLEDYVEELRAANRERTRRMKEEAHDMKREHSKVVDGLIDRIQTLSQRLSENNNVVHQVLVENLQLKSAKTEVENTFNRERKKLIDFLKSNDLDHANLINGPTKLLQNSEIDALVIKKLQGILSRMQNDLIKRENEIEIFRNEFLKMERKLSHAVLEKDEYQKLYEDTVRKMNERNEVLLRRSEAIDKRRKLEAAGFRTDHEELKRYINELEKKLNYCITKHFEKRMMEDIGDTEFFRDTLRACGVGDEIRRKLSRGTECQNDVKSSELRDRAAATDLDSAPVQKTSKHKSAGNNCSKPTTKKIRQIGTNVLRIPGSSKTRQLSVTKSRPKPCNTVSDPRKKDAEENRKENVQHDNNKSKLPLITEQFKEDINRIIKQFNVEKQQDENLPKPEELDNSDYNNNNAVEDLQKQLENASHKLSVLQNKLNYAFIHPSTEKPV